MNSGFEVIVQGLRRYAGAGRDCALAGEDSAELVTGIDQLAESRAELLEALQLAVDSHGVMLMTDPPQDAWKARGVVEKARAAIANATQQRNATGGEG